MYVKIQGGGKNAGVHANTGSSAALVSYLEHEDQERLAEGKEVFPFFTGTGVPVSPGEVIEKLDRNKKKLCKTDAKFFHIDINPSKDEIPYLGSSDAEIVANATFLCNKLADEYARNFNHDKIQGAEDIMIFFKPHFTRGKSDNLEFHIHGIVSRKDIRNSVKLSPMSNHRGTSVGPVKGGFDRKKFQESCEKIFDETFGYDRKVADTFAYKLAMKKGTVEEKVEQLEIMPEEERRELTSQQVELITPGVAAAIESGYKRLDKARRDKFWNDYHSKYKPQYNAIKDACNEAYSFYKSAKEEYSINSNEIFEKSNELSKVYHQMKSYSQNIEQAKTSKSTLNAISALLFLFFPGLAIAMSLTNSIISEANISASINARRALREKANALKNHIDSLKDKQSALIQEKNDKLAIYLENKEAKINLQTEINTLKAELDKPIPEVQKRSLAAFAERYKEHSSGRKSGDSNLDNANLRYNQILEIMRTAENSKQLVNKLSEIGVVLKTISSDNKLKDLRIIGSGEKAFDIKASSFGADKSKEILLAFLGVYRKAQNQSQAQERKPLETPSIKKGGGKKL